MLYVVLFFLLFSLFLYVLLGGADFGAGIMELFSSDKNRRPIKKTVYEVMGPVWEANHIWIIILVVILWIAFPTFYNVLVVSLHIPLTLVLLGVTLRGAAFVFRHYDAIKGSSQKLYDRFFEISCLITPVFLGMTFGGMVSGRIVPESQMLSAGFYQVYLAPWLGLFPFCIGLFYASMCTFLAGVFLIGEADAAQKSMYVRKASIALGAVVVMGFASLIFGYAAGSPFVTGFLESTWSMVSVVFSALLLFPLYRAVRGGRVIWCRFLAGLQVLLILFAALVAHFPDLIIMRQGSIGLFDAKAPDEVLRVLGISLLIGGALILPGLWHLLRSFRLIKMFED